MKVIDEVKAEDVGMIAIKDIPLGVGFCDRDGDIGGISRDIYVRVENHHSNGTKQHGDYCFALHASTHHISFLNGLTKVRRSDLREITIVAKAYTGEVPDE